MCIGEKVIERDKYSPKSTFELIMQKLMPVLIAVHLTCEELVAPKQMCI
jgi:hypothetical protein